MSISAAALRQAADSVLHYAAPVGEKQQYVDRARAAIGQYL